MSFSSYPITVKDSTGKIKQIEFDGSKMFILYDNGLVGIFSYQFIGGKGF